MDFTVAITRTPPENAGEGMTTADLGAVDFDLLLEQHASYIDALRAAGLEVLELSADPAFPDSYFVEDTAVVTPEVAVISRPGAATRLGEEFQIEQVLKRLRPIKTIHVPGTLDGGDVLQVGAQVFVGISQRTNEDGARQLESHLEEYGYTCSRVPVCDSLHLKSDVSWIGEDRLLITERLATLECFKDKFELVITEPEESYAANAVLVNRRLLLPDGYDRLADQLDGMGYDLLRLQTSEFRKMDGGLSCLSLRI